MLELALNGMDLKLRYKNGPFNFQELCVLTASDASFAGEPGSKSQQGRIHFLVPAHQLLDPECCEYDVMIVSFSSTTIERVCRATLDAETYALQNAQEAGDRVRAVLAELYGYGTTGPDWHDASRRAIPHMMLSDCRSLVANLSTEVLSGFRTRGYKLSSTPYANRYSMAMVGVRQRSTLREETASTGQRQRRK